MSFPVFAPLSFSEFKVEMRRDFWEKTLYYRALETKLPAKSLGGKQLENFLSLYMRRMKLKFPVTDLTFVVFFAACIWIVR